MTGCANVEELLRNLGYISEEQNLDDYTNNFKDDCMRIGFGGVLVEPDKEIQGPDYGVTGLLLEAMKRYSSSVKT